MEKDKVDKFFSLIRTIDRKNVELNKYLKGLAIQSRNSLLKDIHNDIVNKNEFFHNINVTPKEIYPDDNEDKQFIDDIIEITISNIEKNPAKRIFYLKKFLDKFEDISENDKNVIIQSLKSVKLENLKESMESLISIFEIRL
ncbi:MAG: hypothetical protein P8Y70_00630 [Candidatus Lokiarchaeota archaeon]